MKRKHEKSLQSNNKNLRWLGNLLEILRPRENIAQFKVRNKILNMDLNQIQIHSNIAKRAELEHQQYNALLYTNIAKVR